MNRVDVDTAMPYFRKASDARMRTVRAGYFTVNFFRLFQSCNWEHTLLYFGGQKRHSHTWTGGNSQWRDQEVELTIALGANREFWARAWTCNWSIWNTDRSYSKFDITWDHFSRISRSQPHPTPHCTRAVYFALLSAHANQVLIDAWNPML